MPRATKALERLYKGRPAVERVKARRKLFWGADDGKVTGARRWQALVGAVRVVQWGLAPQRAQAARWGGRLGPSRLGPIAKALREPVPA